MEIFFLQLMEQQNGNNFINDAIKNNAKTIISNNKYQGLKMGYYLLAINHENY